MLTVMPALCARRAALSAASVSPGSATEPAPIGKVGSPSVRKSTTFFAPGRGRLLAPESPASSRTARRTPAAKFVPPWGPRARMAITLAFTRW